MDGMNDIFGALSSQLPYFSPFSMVNKSGVCACSRILQTRWMGCLSVSVENKIACEANQRLGPGSSQKDRFELYDWQVKQNCVQQVRQAHEALSKGQSNKSGWSCVMHRFQLCEGVASRAEDIGDLLFCEHTTKRWLVVEIAHKPADVTPALRQRAQRLGQQVYGLLTYIGYNPEWVRTAVFFDRLAQGVVDSQAAADGSNFSQVDSTTFKPCLLSSHLDKIDVIIGGDKSLEKSVTKYRDEVGGLAAVRSKVLTSSRDPEDKAVRKGSAKIEWPCGNCQQSAELCSRILVLRL